MVSGGAEPGDLERALDALYAGHPEGFIAARDRLAGELRAAGRRDEAREVARLRRPTLAAWALDHLALRAPDGIDALVAAGKRLRRVHEEVVSGGDPRVLQREAEERRALMASLADEALDVLRTRGGGAPDAHREEIEATLEAVSSDAGVAALVRRGRLTTAAPRPAGFAGLLDLPPPAGSAQEAPTSSPAAEEQDEPRDEPRDEAELARASEEARRLEQRAAEAAADADRAQSAADQAVAEVERLEGELAEARARAASAKEEAKQARARRDEARRAAGAAAGRVRRPDVGT